MVIPRFRQYHSSGFQCSIAAAVSKVQDEAVSNNTHTGPNVLQQVRDAEYYRAVARIRKLRQVYIEQRYAFVEGKDLIPLLKALGARDEDFEPLKVVSNHLKKDPTLPFRETRNGRFCHDFDSETLRRLEFQPFALSVEEDFKRHDSGQTRRFDEVENELQHNTAFQALMLFKAMLFHRVTFTPRPKCTYLQLLTPFNTRSST